MKKFVRTIKSEKKLITIAVAVVACSALVAVAVQISKSPARLARPPLPVFQTREELNAPGLQRPELPLAQELAVKHLSSVSRADDEHFFAEMKHMMDVGPMPEVPLTPEEQVVFDKQWAKASAAALELNTTEKAAAAGYVQGTPDVEGVGAHWINWQLVAEPFNAAKPSMLLFSHIGGSDKLIGFSYFVKSATAPKGFAGTNDMWHRHYGQCIVHGWLVSADMPVSSLCMGNWLNGKDLWMLHAWIVPEFANPWGKFSPANPRICPDGITCVLSDAHPHSMMDM